MKIKMFIRFLGMAAFWAVLGCGQTTSTNASVCVGYSCAGIYGGSTGSSPYPPFTSGDTETLNVVSTPILEEYVGGAVYAPTNLQVNIALLPETATDGTQVYLGTMNIRFQDGSTYHNGSFTNGSSADTYKSDQRFYNNVSKQIDSSDYRIYFEDAMGALILTVNYTGGTDTANAGTATGSIYFLNFTTISGAPNPLIQGAIGGDGNYYPPGSIYCWMIDLGPYDCINNNMPPTGPYTWDGTTVGAYTLLGTIPTINVTTALGL